MREVIQKVIATENEAKQLVQTARAEADRIVSRVRLQARELVEQAEREARQEAEKILVVAEGDATCEKAARLARVTAEIQMNIRLDEETAQQAIEAARRCVCGFSSKGEPSP